MKLLSIWEMMKNFNSFYGAHPTQSQRQKEKKSATTRQEFILQVQPPGHRERMNSKMFLGQAMLVYIQRNMRQSIPPKVVDKNISKRMRENE